MPQAQETNVRGHLVALGRALGIIVTPFNPNPTTPRGKEIVAQLGALAPQYIQQGQLIGVRELFAATEGKYWDRKLMD
jgi:hypothetical protein